MPDAVSFRITTYTKLAKGEPGLTQRSSLRLAASEVIDWVLDELPEDAIALSHDGNGGDVVTLIIDWSKVPGSIRHPKIPGRMTHLRGPS